MRVWYERIVSKNRIPQADRMEGSEYVKYVAVNREWCCSAISQQEDLEIDFAGVEGAGIYIIFKTPSYGDPELVQVKTAYCPFCGAKHETFQAAQVQRVVTIRSRTIPEKVVYDESFVDEYGTQEK